jgi:putative Ca2+/H+ antiporter (TMEM165/GDT1 family)
MSLAALAASFALVALAELGDKTQIAVITLSSRFKVFSVFVGAMLAFLVTTGVGVAIGDALTLVLPTFWIRVAAAILFIVFGVYTIVSVILKRDEAEFKAKKETRNGVYSSFSLILLMELGDKTQLSVIALTAEYEFPLFVFAGVMLAFALITALGVTVGMALTRFVPLKYIQLASGAVFLLLGIVFLITTILGVA